MLGAFNVSGQQLEAARRAIDAEQYQHAGKLLKELQRTSSKAGAAYYYLGEVYMRTGNVDSARTAFKQGIRLEAKFPLNYVGLGQDALSQGNVQAARTYFEKALSLSKKRNFETPLAIANAFMNASKPDIAAALPYLQKADELDKADKAPEIFMALGNYYAAQGNLNAGLENYTKALAIDSNFSRASLQIGEMYVDGQQYALADSLLQTLAKTEPDFGPTYRIFSEMYKAQYLLDSTNTKAAKLAGEYYQRYLDATGRSFDGLLNYAQLLYDLRDFKNLEQAAGNLSGMYTSNKQKSNMMLRLQGYAAYENGRFPTALQYLNSLFIAADNAAELRADDYLYLSLTHQALRSPQLAYDNALKAIKVDATKTAALENIALAYYTARNWVKAVELYSIMKSMGAKPAKLAELNLYHGTALYFQYVEGFNKQGNASRNLLSQALALYDEALKVSPDLMVTHLWKARALYLLEDPYNPQGLMVAPYQAYIDGVERSNQPQTAATKRNIVEAYTVMANFAVRRNDKDAARNFWSKVLLLDPQYPDALAGMKSLNASVRNARKSY